MTINIATLRSAFVTTNIAIARSAAIAPIRGSTALAHYAPTADGPHRRCSRGTCGWPRPLASDTELTLLALPRPTQSGQSLLLVSSA